MERSSCEDRTERDSKISASKIDMMQLQAKEHWPHRRLEGARNASSPTDLEGSMVMPTPWFPPWDADAWLLDFNCKRAALCCFKWSVVWSFVLANTGSQSSIYDLFSDTWKCFLILIAFWFIYLFFFSMVVYYRILNIDCLFRGSLQPHVIRHRGNHHHYQPCELLSVWCLPRCV